MSLIGTWFVDETDIKALNELGNVLLEFCGDGQLVYTIRGEVKHQIIKLRYKVDGSVIMTDQPSSPRVEHTEFCLSGDGSLLTLKFGGTPYRFSRLGG